MQNTVFEIGGGQKSCQRLHNSIGFNTPLLSIIIPIYNAEQSLVRCIESIIGQSFNSFELLLIDDGSSDTSGLICDNYAWKDKRIRSIHKKNGGVASARNLGLELAMGDFITFVDSDDYLGNIDTYKNNISIFLDNSLIDIVQYPTYLVENGNKKILYKPKEQLLLGNEILKNWYKGNGLINYCVWNKIYRRAILNNIRFPRRIIFEDIIFCTELMDKVQTVFLSEVGGYNHCYRCDSITRKKENNIKLQIDAVYARSIVSEKVKKYPFLAIDRINFLMTNLKMYLEVSSKVKAKELDYAQRELKDLVPNLEDSVGFIKYNGLFNKNSIKLLIIKILGLKLYSKFYVFILHIKQNKI